MYKQRFISFCCLLVIGSRLFASEIVDLELDVSGDVSVLVDHYIADSSSLLIWLPSERGVSSESSSIAKAVADLGSNVWMVDLHDSYMVPASRYSIDRFPAKDIIQLFRFAEQKGYRQIYLASSSRGAKLALDAIYLYCQRYPKSELLRGSLLFHPNLFKPVMNMGQQADFVDGSDISHLPVYMIQSEFSTKYAYTQDTRRRLEQGGSQVFTHILPEVEAGFVSRAADDLTGESLRARQQIPKIIDNAVKLLSTILPTRLPAIRKQSIVDKSKIPARVNRLQVFEGNRQSRALKLINLNGAQIELSDYLGRVVLLNFWASWCKPCVEEIPSLVRLSQYYDASRFAVVTVNIGESRQRVSDFIKPFNPGFDVLLDETGVAVRDWRVYAFPSNFLIDKNGLIQYGHSGALEWDSKEVLKVIETLL